MHQTLTCVVTNCMTNKGMTNGGGVWGDSGTTITLVVCFRTSSTCSILTGRVTPLRPTRRWDLRVFQASRSTSYRHVRSRVFTCIIHVRYTRRSTLNVIHITDFTCVYVQNTCQIHQAFHPKCYTHHLFHVCLRT